MCRKISQEEDWPDLNESCGETQFDLVTTESYGADHLDQTACTGKPDNQALTAWVYEKLILIK